MSQQFAAAGAGGQERERAKAGMLVSEETIVNGIFEPSEAAKAEGVCHTEAECRQLYENLDPEKRAGAIAHLKKVIEADPDAIQRVREMYAKHGADWFDHLHDPEIEKLTPEERERGMAGLYSPHFGWGMAIRNSLRSAGFGEEELGVHNLDDVYRALLDSAVEEICR